LYSGFEIKQRSEVPSVRLGAHWDVVTGQHSTTQAEFFYVVGTVHFEMKLYDNQHNAQVFFIYFLIYFCLTCFGLSLSPSSRGTVYKFGSGSSLLGMVSASGPGPTRHRSVPLLRCPTLRCRLPSLMYSCGHNSALFLHVSHCSPSFKFEIFKQLVVLPFCFCPKMWYCVAHTLSKHSGWAVLTVTQCYVTLRDIWNEKTSFNPDRTPKKFWKLMSSLFLETYITLTNSFWKKKSACIVTA
jgi:hypothetical protein